MRVGVNLLWCRPGKVGGSEEYLARQLAGLAAVAPEISATLLVPPGFVAAHPELDESFELVTADAATRWRSVRVLAEAIALPPTIMTADVVHHAGGTLPAARRPGTPARPTVLTIHDLQYLRFPLYFSRPRRSYLRLRMSPSARAASVIATPSAFVRRTVIESFDVDPDRLVVVPHGYDPPPPDALPSAEELRARYGLGDRRVLVYPAITHPHKNHRLLVDLLAGPWADPEIVLLLLGGRGSADDALTEAIASARVAERVVRPGRIPPGDRDGLVSLAEALVFPSQYEGFGAPVIEAMALGTPVVCSDQTALPEVAGDAAVVRPLTVDAWADALKAVAANRAELIARGRRRSAEFTTAASGSALADAYRLALAAGGR